MQKELDMSSNLELPDICHQEPVNQIIKPTLASSGEIIDLPKDEEISTQEKNSNCLNCDLSVE